jgi:peptide subunit release factor 1 (eRF1)
MSNGSFVERLKSIQVAGGPFVSLALQTKGDSELAPQKIETRWRDLRREAAGQVPDKALLLIDDLVGGAHRDGRGLFAVTGGEELLFVRHLPDEIGDDLCVGPIPHLLPLLDWVQNHPSYAVVNVDRTGGEIHVVGAWSETTIEVEGDHDEIRKVNTGGWSHRRFQNRAEDSWEQNAEEVADKLAAIMRAEGLSLAILLGDVRARAFLKEHMPSDLRESLIELDVEPRPGDDLENVREEIEAAASRLLADKIESVLQKFQEERGQDDLAADGLEATFEALRMGQVETLLLRSSGTDQRAWFSRSDLTQGALRKEALSEIGLDDLAEAPVDGVLVRQALGTGAAICVVPDLSDEHGPRGGVGAILRFKTDSKPTA